MDKTPYQVTVNNTTLSVSPDAVDALDIVSLDENSFHILKNNKAYNAVIESVDYKNKLFTININGTRYTTKISDKYDRLIDKLGMKVGSVQKAGDIKAPMPGLVLEVSVKVGDTITKGDKVLILEAMKMENVIKAAGDGIVKAIHIQKGTAVEKGQILIEIGGQ
jgi:biotin carboxyl carrier protein